MMQYRIFDAPDGRHVAFIDDDGMVAELEPTKADRKLEPGYYDEEMQLVKADPPPEVSKTKAEPVLDEDEEYPIFPGNKPGQLTKSMIEGWAKRNAHKFSPDNNPDAEPDLEAALPPSVRRQPKVIRHKKRLGGHKLSGGRRW